MREDRTESESKSVLVTSKSSKEQRKTCRGIALQAPCLIIDAQMGSRWQTSVRQCPFLISISPPFGLRRTAFPTTLNMNCNQKPDFVFDNKVGAKDKNRDISMFCCLLSSWQKTKKGTVLPLLLLGAFEKNYVGFRSMYSTCLSKDMAG